MSYSQALRVRSGGSVKRFHTMPTVGEQSVAAHSWGVAMILLEICTPSARLLQAALTHDLHEFETGDVPSNVKAEFPGLRTILCRIEEVIDEKLRLVPKLTADEQSLLRIADLMEILFYVREQEMLGNMNLRIAWERVIHYIDTEFYPLPPKAESLLSALIADYESMFEELPTPTHYKEQDHA